MSLKPIEDHSWQPSTDLTSICLQKEVNGKPAILGLICGQHVESPAIVDFQGRNYRYISVATQIPFDIRLRPF